MSDLYHLVALGIYLYAHSVGKSMEKSQTSFPTHVSNHLIRIYVLTFNKHVPNQIPRYMILLSHVTDPNMQT